MTKIDFGHMCSTYAETFQFWGGIFIVGAFIAVLVLTALQVIAALKTPRSAEIAGRGGPSEVLQAITAVIDSLSKAPTWLAMLAGGIAMMWMSVNLLPAECPKMVTTTS